MESLAAFGLACNIIQVIDASWKTYENYTEFRERGTTARADELRHSTQHLVECNKSLQDSLSNAPNFQLLPSGVDLTELTKNFIESAEELGKELKGIKVEPGSRLQERYLGTSARWDLENFGEELNREKLRRRVLTCCAGFLEVHGQADEWPWLTRDWLQIRGKPIFERYPDTSNRLVEIYKSLVRLSVSYLHRTAQQYLETESGKRLLKAQPLEEHELFMRLYKSTLVLIILCMIEHDPDAMRSDLEFLLSESFQDYLDINPQVAYAMFLQLEEICENLTSMGFYSVEWTKHNWPFLNETDDLDYMKAFVPFSHAACAEHKLRSSGLVDSRDYLNDLLRSCLLNQFMKDDPKNQLPLWTSIIIWGYRDLEDGRRAGKFVPRFLRACVKAGADLDSWIPLLLTKNERLSVWRSSMATRAQKTCDKPFILFRVKACDFIMRCGDTSVADLLHEAGAVSERPYLVVFAPPNAWFTLAADISALQIELFPERETHDSGLLEHIRLGTRVLRDLVEGGRILKSYDNAMDALYTAGFSDGEIRQLPIPQTIWEDHERGRGEIHNVDMTIFQQLLGIPDYDLTAEIDKE